jgi:parvulin-like peptidyl-prolyl isomerase
MKNKLFNGSVIIILILLIMIVVMGTLLSQTSSNSFIEKYNQENYLSLSVQRITNISSEVKQACPEVKEGEKYNLVSLNDGTAKNYIVDEKVNKVVCDLQEATSNQERTSEKQLIAGVNGEKIYMNDVLAIYNQIPENQRNNNSMQMSLDRVIKERILLDYAKKNSFNPTPEEVEAQLQSFLQANQITMEQLQEQLQSNGGSLAEFKEGVRKGLMVSKAAETLTNTVSVTDEEMQAYYDENKALFVTPNSANIKQILLRANESNLQEKKESAEVILGKTTSEDFCDLVTEYSEDQSTIATCGVYEFSQGQLLPEFETEVFNSELGDAKIIETSLGVHVVIVEDLIPAKELSYEEVKEQIRNGLLAAKKSQVLEQKIAALLEEAEVKSYI